MLDRLSNRPFSEKRQFVRHPRQFQMKLKGRIFSGYNISQKGLAIITSPSVLFSANETFLFPRVESKQNFGYSIKELVLKSRYLDNDQLVYGFEIVKLDKEEAVKHQLLVSGLSEPKEPAIEALNQVRTLKTKNISLNADIINKLFAIAEHPELDDFQSRQKLQQYLSRIKQVYQI